MVITFYQKDATLSILFSRISVNLIEGPRLNLQKSRSNVFFAMGVALHIITCPPSPPGGRLPSAVRIFSVLLLNLTDESALSLCLTESPQ